MVLIESFFLQQQVLEMGGGLRIKFISDSKKVYTKQIIGDVYLNFVEFAWSEGSGRVGVFIAAMPRTGFAFDFAKRTEIPFSEMKDEVAERIRREYHLSSAEDPFDCLKCMREFTKEHPSELTH